MDRGTGICERVGIFSSVLEQPARVVFRSSSHVLASEQLTRVLVMNHLHQRETTVADCWR